VGLAGCQLLGLDGAPEQPGSAELEGRAAPDALAYPNLHTVPPRPQLSYSVEQQREIVERLISDREHARYTDRLIRYESGLSSLPPPPAPPQALADTDAAVDQVVRARPQAPTAEPEAMPARRAAETRYRVDDDSLGDVMRDLVRDTAPPAAATPSAAPAGPPAPGGDAPGPAEPTEQEPADVPAASPPQDEAQSLTERLFGWIGDLFDEEAPAAPASEPSATPDGGESAAGVAAEPAAGAAAHARPLLKPMPVAMPPRPSPIKPQGALAAGSADAGAGARQGDLELVVFGTGPDQVRVVPLAGRS
jgi:hypothetical protein